MSITNTMLEAFMQLASERQEVISKNVANSNVPGELSRDIKMPQNFSELLKSGVNNAQVHVITTNSMHIGGSKPKLRSKTIIDTEGELKPNGNNIEAAHEAKKSLKNKFDFEMALKAYKESADLVKVASGKQQGR